MITSGGIAGYLYGVNNSEMALLDREGHYFIKGIKDGAVELYHDNVKKFETGTNYSIVNSVSNGNPAGLKIFNTNNSSNYSHAELRLESKNGASYGAIFNDHQNGCVRIGHNTTGNTLEVFSDGVIRMQGIKFNNDISDSNKLDDYEEGTWTPLFGPATGSYSSISHNSQSGYYTKIGRLVNIWFRIDISAINTSGASSYLKLLGLPFQAASGTGVDGGTLNVNYYHSIANMGDKVPSGYLANGTSFVVMGRVGGSAWTNISATDMGTTNFYAHMSYYS